MAKDSASQSIAERLKSPPPYPCTAVFTNELPASWDVHIIAVGADFFYDDGTSAQVGPVAVDVVGPSGTVSLSSPNPLKCVNKVFGGASVKAPGEDPHLLTKTNTGQPGFCMLQTFFRVVPINTVKSAAHAKGLKVEDVVELIDRS